MIVQVVSIPHNGTQFLMNLLNTNNIKFNVSCHITPTQWPEIETYENIIMPLRHPKDVAESWGRRGKDYGWDFMYNKLPLVNAHHFFMADKDKAVEKLSKHLNKQLVVDWAKVNHSDNEPVRVITKSQISMATKIYNQIKKVGVNNG